MQIYFLLTVPPVCSHLCLASALNRKIKDEESLKLSVGFQKPLHYFSLLFSFGGICCFDSVLVSLFLFCLLCSMFFIFNTKNIHHNSKEKFKCLTLATVTSVEILHNSDALNILDYSKQIKSWDDKKFNMQLLLILIVAHTQTSSFCVMFPLWFYISHLRLLQIVILIWTSYVGTYFNTNWAGKL